VTVYLWARVSVVDPIWCNDHRLTKPRTILKLNLNLLKSWSSWLNSRKLMIWAASHTPRRVLTILRGCERARWSDEGVVIDGYTVCRTNLQWESAWRQSHTTNRVMNKIVKNTNDFTPEWRDKYNEFRVALTMNKNKKYNNIIIYVMIALNATYNKKSST